jgi:hypothetical protein
MAELAVTRTGLPTGARTLAVRAVGWEPVTISVELTTREPRTVVVPLTVKTAVLDAVIVTARLDAGYHRVGFDQRRRQGIGHFLAADDIDKKNALDFHELVSGMPGVRLAYGRNGTPRITGTRGNSSCVAYSVDGVPYREMQAGDIDTYIRPSEVGAVEVYQVGEAPASVTRVPTMSRGPAGRGTMSVSDCLAILIWTKTRLGL